MTLQFVFYCSVLQEAIQFNIVPPLVVQDLTKNLDEFNWESFEVWLDSISANLIACQDRESRGGAPLGDEEIESFHCFLSSTHGAFMQKIQPSCHPKKRGESTH